jgi:hypothetical protein
LTVLKAFPVVLERPFFELIEGFFGSRGNRQAVDKLDDGLDTPNQFGVETKWKHFERKEAPEEKADRQVNEKNWSHPPESNRRPTDYESVALPTELGWLRWV